MKRCLSFILTLVMVIGIITSVPVTVSATSESDLVFTLDSNYYTVTGCSPEASGEIIIPSEYEGLPVKWIGGYAFKGCQGVTSIVISEGVEGLAWYAFADCPNLVSVTFGEDVSSIGVSMFDNCINLAEISVDENNEEYTSEDGVLFNKDKTMLIQYPLGKADKVYTIPDTVTNIYQGSFRGSVNLETVIISDSVTDIVVGAFAFSEKLKSVIISDSVQSIDGIAFFNCPELKAVAIPGSVTTIGGNAFGYYYSETYELLKVEDFKIYGVKGSAAEIYANENGFEFIEGSEVVEESVLTFELNEDGESYSVTGCDKSASGEIVIPSTFNDKPVNAISDEAFVECASITKVIIPDSVTSIGFIAFGECESLESIEIPDSVISIGDGAFALCSSLNSITLSDNISSIGYATFSNCTSLTSIEIPDTVTSIGEYAFTMSGIKTITFPDSVNYIGTEAFAGCEELETIIFENGDIEIGSSSFVECTSLESVTIGDGVTNIGGYAFFWCENLVSVSLGDGETSIGGFAFYECVNLESIENLDTVTSIGDYAFAACAKLASVKFSDSLTDISDGAFCYCTSLSSLTIPDSVTSIGVGAFGGCESLASVTIGKGVTNISAMAFCECPNLTEVYYGGTESEWENITIGEENTGLADATIHFSCNVHSYGDWVVAQEPTCTEEGSKYKVCSVCADVVTETITATGHIAGDWIVESESTCETDGYRYKECTICSEIIETEVTAILGHNYSTEWTVDKEPTCTEEGSKSRHCTICGDKTDVTVITAIGHTVTDWVIDKNPTCSEEGSHFKYCTECGVTLETEEIAKKAHTASGWKTEKEATVYKAGLKYKECTVCGEILETENIPQLKCSQPVLKKVYNANSYVKVTWGTVKGADLYRVYRKTGTGDYEYIGSTQNTYFNDKEAGAGKTCRYRIKAKNEAGYSEYSASIAIKHIDEPTLKSIENSAYGVLIKWDKVTGAQKYSVYRKVSGGEYEYIGATTNAYYTDKTAKSGTKYYYAIRGKRDDSVSSQSASLSKYYLEDPTLNTPTTTTKGVGLRWSKVTGAEGYMVYRRTASGSYKRITTEKGVDNVTYRDTTAKKGTKYYYKVKAYYSKTYSEYSNTKSVTDKY